MATPTEKPLLDAGAKFIAIANKMGYKRSKRSMGDIVSMADQSKNLVKRLTQICLRLSQGDYDYAKDLFELTRKEKKNPEIISQLAESFGLMLVKIEGREFLLKKTIEELKTAKSELETAQLKLKKENRSLVNQLAASKAYFSTIAQSHEMKKIMDQVAKIADTAISVLITGDTGTGKEVIARELHNQSSRNSNDFVSLNCSAIPESLIESELFGIEKGVASGVGKRKGKIEQAHKGTLFLDEIGDMPLSSQAKILRVLEERVVEPVGSDKSILVDIRIVAATNKDLKTEINANRFRSDLYYRLKVINIELPKLCQRKEDILPLCKMFINRFAVQYEQPNISISKAAANCLESYAWPGNIRELKNEIERAVALSTSDTLHLEDLSDSLTQKVKIKPIDEIPTSSQYSLREMEKKHIQNVLKAVEYNKSRAARELGISREGLRKKMQRIGL